MTSKKLTDLNDQELLKEAKRLKSAAIGNAILIGFLIGIVCYSILENTLGFFTLIPLFLAYKLINSSKYDKQEIDALLKQRNLR